MSRPRSSWAAASAAAVALRRCRTLSQGLGQLVQLPLRIGEDLKVQLPAAQVIRCPAELPQRRRDTAGVPAGQKYTHQHHQQTQRNGRQDHHMDHAVWPQDLLPEEEGDAVHQKLFSIRHLFHKGDHHRHDHRQPHQQRTGQHEQDGAQKLAAQGGFLGHGQDLLKDVGDAIGSGLFPVKQQIAAAAKDQA